MKGCDYCDRIQTMTGRSHCPLHAETFPTPHACDCRCDQCVNMAKAIGAEDENGEYVFSDEELYRLALQNDQEDGDVSQD